MKFTTQQIVAMVLGGIVLLGAGYWAGAASGHGVGARNVQFGIAGQPGAGFAARGAGDSFAVGGRMGMAGAMGSGAAIGTILSQDANSITIATQGGGSRIVLVSASTTVMTEATSSLSSLHQGQMVTVFGAQNADGSVSARSIQARP